MIPQNLFMMALFGDFYYKSYVQKAKKREPVVTTSIENQNGTNGTNGKLYTNGDSRHRYTNGTATTHTNGDAKNGYMNGNSNGNATNGQNGQTNGNVIKHINEMS